jgi:hypothetical protein
MYNSITANRTRNKAFRNATTCRISKETQNNDRAQTVHVKTRSTSTKDVKTDAVMTMSSGGVRFPGCCPEFTVLGQVVLQSFNDRDLIESAKRKNENILIQCLAFSILSEGSTFFVVKNNAELKKRASSIIGFGQAASS